MPNKQELRKRLRAKVDRARNNRNGLENNLTSNGQTPSMNDLPKGLTKGLDPKLCQEMLKKLSSDKKSQHNLEDLIRDAGIMQSQNSKDLIKTDEKNLSSVGIPFSDHDAKETVQEITVQEADKLFLMNVEGSINNSDIDSVSSNLDD